MVPNNFEEAYELAKLYVSNPEELRKELLRKEGSPVVDRLVAPYADRFSFWLTYYKGFYKYPNRLKNYVKAIPAPHDKRRDFMPFIADIEPNSRCNFKCTMCQVSEWDDSKRSNDMDFEVFKSFIEQNDYFTEIKLHGMGEPFLSKEFIEMVRFLSDRYIWVRTSTNGSVLHVKDAYRKVIDAGIGEIQCSFDGATAEVYEGIRVGGNFEIVRRNFTILNEYANTKDRLYTRMWVLLQKKNRHQLFDFVRLAANMGFRRLSFSISLNDWGQTHWKDKNSGSETGSLSEVEENGLLELAKRYDINVTVWQQASKYERAVKPCHWPFSRPYISSDMKMAPCCMIGNPDVINLGSAKNFAIEWNSKAYMDFREAHISGNIPDCCKSCYTE